MPDSPDNITETPEDITIPQADVLKMQQEHKEEMASLRQQTADQATQFNETLRSLAADRQNVPQPTTTAPTLTREQLKEIIETGEDTEKILDAMDQIAEAKINKVVAEQIDPLRIEGAAALTQMATVQAEANPEMPFYKRFKKEIEEQLKYLQPAQRANPEYIKKSYQMIVGQNYETLMNESKEELLRKQSDPAQTSGGLPPSQSFSRGQSSETPKIKTMEEDLSPEALAHIQEKEWDQEKYAKASGFSSFEDLQVFKQDKTPDKDSYYQMLKERKAANAA